ncbi:LysR substrate-binding domain-containing protein [Paracoccus nototheniae]|uniref:LysR substrate-binding domain-containing protein n=1 Tax=Paracoccus nototheniae TaxID=2489002 RepID=A0ABW4E096_9RHOB|nr:LysR substrate-binding domain-containing protein [Paracoccus nototheniae]
MVAPDISLRLLEIFSAMMRAETTVEAAEALGVSQPAVSAGLRQLEVQLGITLFERTHRRLVPTAEARLLYEEIKPVFGLMRSFAGRARDIRQGKSGRLRVIATPPLGHTLAPRALRHFLQGRPDVSVAYDVRRLEHVLEAVQTGAADLGLALSMDRDPSVNTEVLHQGHMVALVPACGDLAGRAAITPQDLGPDLGQEPGGSGFGLIGLAEESILGLLVKTAFDQAGVAYAPRVEVRYASTAAVLANETGGATVIDPYTAAFHGTPQMAIRPFSPPCGVSAILITRKGVPRPHLVHSFIAELRPLFSDLISPARS